VVGLHRRVLTLDHVVERAPRRALERLLVPLLDRVLAALGLGQHRVLGADDQPLPGLYAAGSTGQGGLLLKMLSPPRPRKPGKKPPSSRGGRSGPPGRSRGKMSKARKKTRQKASRKKGAKGGKS